MMHTNRTHPIVPAASAEDLAHKLTGGMWINSYELSGYLFLNDSIGAENNNEYALVKKPQERGGAYLQLDSITFGRCPFQKALDLVKRTVAGEFDGSASTHKIEQPKLEPAFDSLERYFVYLTDPSSLKHGVGLLAKEISKDELISIPEPGRIVQVTEATYDFYLDALPPRWMRGIAFCFAEGMEPYRLFWRKDDHYFLRQLSWDETHHFLKIAMTVARNPKVEPAKSPDGAELSATNHFDLNNLTNETTHLVAVAPRSAEPPIANHDNDSMNSPGTVNSTPSQSSQQCEQDQDHKITR
jgi:hypothetical protein